MNKPAFWAIAALFTLGMLSWFAANQSFYQFLNGYQQAFNNREHGVLIEIPDIQTDKKAGKISTQKLSLIFGKVNEQQSEQQVQLPKLTFSDINLSFDPKSLKLDVLPFNSIMTKRLHIELDKTNALQQLSQMQQTLTALVAKQADPKMGVNLTPEPVMKVEQALIESINVTLFDTSGDKPVPVQEIVFSKNKLAELGEPAPLSWYVFAQINQWLKHTETKLVNELN